MFSYVILFHSKQISENGNRTSQLARYKNKIKAGKTAVGCRTHGNGERATRSGEEVISSNDAEVSNAATRWHSATMHNVTGGEENLILK